MKRIIQILVGVFIVSSIYGQRISKYDFEIDLGGGAGLYKGYTNLYLNADLIAVPTYFTIKSAYAVKNGITIGIGIRVGSYLTGKDTNTAYQNSSLRNIFISPRYYFVNSSKLICFLGTNIGFGSFTYEIANFDGGYGKFEAGSTLFSFTLGFKKYFGKHIGFFMQTNYDIQPYRLAKMRINDINTNYYDKIKVTDIHFNFSGMDLEAGLSLHF